MCGICGFFNLSDEDSINPERIIRNMLDVLVHRGPNDEGIYHNARIGMGIKRLSIIDLESGHQPIHNEDKTVYAICNGEIYNFKELRADLIKRGHKFYTKSDSEVIVHLFEDHGLCFPEKINGMFAIALWDDNGQRLVVVRDRIGIKPLFYSEEKNRIVFASEIKAIIKSGIIDPTVNCQALDDYLHFGYIPSPESVLRNVHKLPQGCMLVCSPRDISLQKYWSLPLKNEFRGSENDLLKNLEDLMFDSVSMQTRSDVPLGVFLSGGLDSTLILYMASRISRERVKTFTLHYDDAQYDESVYAKEVANYFSSEHFELRASSNELSDLLLRIIWFLDEPLADSSAIPVFLISELAKQHITVALSGEGGDELFGGYAKYWRERYFNLFALPPELFKRAAMWSISAVASGARTMDLRRRVERNFRIAFSSKEERFANSSVFFNNGMRSSLYQSDFRKFVNLRRFNPGMSEFLSILKEQKVDNLLKPLLFDLSFYLPDDLLAKADRMSMANSLEVRVPLLDHRIVELVAPLSFDLKMCGGKGKYLIRKILAGKVPDLVLKRRKMGFAVPLRNWFRGELSDFVSGILLDSKVYKRGYFNKDFIIRMLKEHIGDKQDHSHRIWSLLVLEMWMKEFMDG